MGRGYYYSEQENLWLLKLLKHGYQPDTVIFLDGINERCSIETYQQQMKTLFAKAQKSNIGLIDYFLNLILPTLQLSSKILDKLNIDLSLNQLQNQNLHSLKCSFLQRTVSLADVLRENLRTRQSICKQYKIKCVTFVQPFPEIHAIHEDNMLSQENRTTIKKVFEHITPVFKQEKAIFITDSLAEYKTHSFVDAIHYASEANKRIAQRIADHIN